MEMSVKEMKTLATAVKRWSVIENERDLKKNKLSLNDYRVLSDGLKSLSNTGKFTTFISGVANWLRRQGCAVTMDSDNVNYIITLA